MNRMVHTKGRFLPLVPVLYLRTARGWGTWYKQMVDQENDVGNINYLVTVNIPSPQRRRCRTTRREEIIYHINQV